MIIFPIPQSSSGINISYLPDSCSLSISNKKVIAKTHEKKEQ